MLIISARDNENNKLKRKGKKQRGGTTYSESERAKWFL